MQCPECGGTTRVIRDSTRFCLDCDWDNLKNVDFSKKIIAVDAEWYTKTQLQKYRRWNKADFATVPADFFGGYHANKPRPTGEAGYYYHRSTVENHEATQQFQKRRHNWKRRQLHIPDDQKIEWLAWTLCVRGDELLRNGWSKEMIDKLPPYRQHKWRKKRVFRLCDLSKVSKTFRISENETK